MTEIDIWCWPTGGLESDDVTRLARVLSASERERAARFVHDRDRRDHVAAHALVRHALSSLDARARAPGSAPRCETHPSAWRFEPDAHGKPVVVPPGPGESVPFFNLSHAPGLVACAVSRAAPVGIDVEPVAARAGADAVAREQFSAEEAAELAALGGEARTARFVELWTLKEAYLKGVGAGLWGPDVTPLRFAFDGDGRLRRHPVEGSPWEFAVSAPLPGYRMAVATPVAREDRSWLMSVHAVDGASPPAVWRGTGRLRVRQAPALPLCGGDAC